MRATSIVGTVESVYKTEAAYLGSRTRYSYAIDLDDGQTIMLKDLVGRPHIIGSRIAIERVTRESGQVYYRIAELQSAE